MRSTKGILTLLLVIAGAFAAAAQDTYRLEAGCSLARDTYLSPLRYSGAGLAVTGSWQRGLAAGWAQVYDLAIESSFLKNPRGNASMYNLGLGFDWSALREFRPLPSLTIGAGAGAGLAGGALYLPRNGNNPATGRAEARLNLAARVSWRVCSGRVPVSVSDEVLLPSLVVFFCQGYGESYYEIYLGNRKGLLHCGWWGNNFCINNLLSVNIGLGRRTLQAGYRFKFDGCRANNLDRRIIFHSVVIGLTI